jgi:hypothetical protein
MFTQEEERADVRLFQIARTL